MNTIKSLKKAFTILELFLEIKQKDLHLSEIAKLSGLKMATANRLAVTLVELGYLGQVEKRGPYTLGVKFLYFNNILNKINTISDTARPHLIKLNESTGETVVLVSFDGKKTYFSDSILSKHALRIHPDLVQMIPLYCSGHGKIFLAEMTEKELEAYFKNNDIQAYTPNTITDPDALIKHLMKVKREGVGYDNEELLSGVKNVASGIKNSRGKIIYCVGVLAPGVRLTKSKMKKVAGEVKQCALDISRKLGYSGV